MMAAPLPVLLLLAAATPLLANETGSVPLTLQEALARARESSARLGQLQSLTDAAGASLRAARAARLPQLELQAAYARNSDVPELVVQVPGVFSQTVFPNIPDQLRTRATLTLPLYTGGRVEGGVQSAGANTRAAEQDLEAAQNDLALETRTAYWALVAARESERVLAEAVSAFESHLRDAANRARFGLAARNEVLLVQVERDRAELSRLRAENSAALANANLLRLTGLAASERIEPVEPRQTLASPEPPIEPLVALALRSRPESAALRARVAAAEAGVRSARSARLPQASLSAAYDYARPNTRILPLLPEWKGTWSIGASVSWTAFDGGRAQAGASHAEALALAARRQLDQLEQRLRLELTASTSEVVTSRAALLVAERGLEAARESLRVAKDRYREGVASSSDLLDAEVAVLRAGLDQTQAAVQARLAAASLERALGR